MVWVFEGAQAKPRGDRGAPGVGVPFGPHLSPLPKFLFKNFGRARLAREVKNSLFFIFHNIKQVILFKI